MVDHVRHRLAEPLDLFVGDGSLDRLGPPFAGDDRRPHPDTERAGILRVRGQWRQPGRDVVTIPVDHRSLREICQIPLELGKLAIEDQAGALDLVVFVEPTDRLALPFTLDLGPGRSLQETYPRASRVECDVLGCSDVVPSLRRSWLITAAGLGLEPGIGVHTGDS